MAWTINVVYDKKCIKSVNFAYSLTTATSSKSWVDMSTPVQSTPWRRH